MRVDLDELAGHWTLLDDERELIAWKRGPTRLGFAVLLKFYARAGRFPRGRAELDDEAVAFVARQVGVPASDLGFYEWTGSTIDYHRAQIRRHLGFRECTADDADRLTGWLADGVCQAERRADRLAAVQLVRLRAASQGQVAGAFGVDPGTIWRWDQALAADGVAGLVPARRGPKGASKLTPQLVERIAGLDAAGASLREIAAATGVSTFSVRNALGRVPPARQAAGDGAAAGEPLPVLPDPVPRDGERALARWGLLGEGAVPVFVPGARYPLAGLLLALPALEDTGLLQAARGVYGRLKDGFCGLGATLLTLVFLALAGEPRAEGATRVQPAALGRVLGLDRAPAVKTIRRKLAELAAAGKAAELVMALARRHAAARPDALGFLHVDGHARVYCGTRTVQKTHVARLKFPAPATMETWVTDQDGDPVFMVVAEPSDSLAGELRRLLPSLRQVAGEGRRVTVCFDRGGWSPALFADITAAGFGLLTWRKGPAPDLPAEVFTTVACTDDRGRAHEYELADSTVELSISEGPRKGQTVTLRQVTRRVPAKGRRHPADPRADLPHRPACRGGLLADDLAVAGGELLPLRPHPVRPGRAGLLRRRAG